MGRSAIIVNPYTHLGGMTSSGLGHTDWGRRQVIGGLSREFYQRVRDYYRDDSRWIHEPRSSYLGQRHLRADDDAQWGFEPHAAEEVFKSWLQEYDVPVVDGRLDRRDGRGVVKDGQGDHRVQSYCYRLCLTNAPENKVPFEQPEGYEESTYELLFRMFEAGETRIPWLPAGMPNRKTDTNNRWAVSMNVIGGSDEYPEASYERRREIEKQHEDWQRGLMWTLANHPRVPEHVRNEVSKWGYAKDEFVKNNHWPHMIYIRVGRRMVGDYVMTEHDCRLTRTAPDSVGMGSYTMDSHNVQRYVTPQGYVQNEGNIEVRPAGPYAISYRSIVPKRGEAENLLVPWAVSSSHIAFGSIRMEPVFMILGQSAATAAAIAIDDGVTVQEVDYPKLRARLLKDGQKL